jgi:hypothetical protein
MKTFSNYLLLIFCISYSTAYSQGPFAEKKLVEGFVITLKGDSIPATVELTKNLNSGEFTVFCASQGLTLRDRQNKKIKVNATNTRKFGYLEEGKLYYFQLVNQFIPNDPIANRMFLKLEVDGYLKLYSNSCDTREDPFHVRGVYTKAGGWIFVDYYLQKGDENPFDWFAIDFKPKVSEYLKEDAELAAKIQNGDLKQKDLKIIVNEYNRWYKYERAAK